MKNYFRVAELLLKICGVSLSGNESSMYKIYSAFVLSCFTFAYPFIACGDIFKHAFYDSVRAFLYVMTGFLYIVMMFPVLRNPRKLRKLLDKLEEPTFLPNQERGGDIEQQLIEQWISYINKQRITMNVLIMTSTLLGFGYAFILRIRYSDSHMWIFNYGPLTILGVTQSPYYEISWIYQTVWFTLLGLSFSSIVNILSGSLAFASVQFQILQNCFRNIADSSRQKAMRDIDICGTSASTGNSSNIPVYGPPPWKYLQSALKEAVCYHLKIFELIYEVEEIFTTAMLSLYLCIVFGLCIAMYILSSAPVFNLNILKMVGEAVAGCTCTLLICYWGERVAHESEMVGLAAYESNFVGADLRFQKSLIIILKRSQHPLRIKAGNFIETSLTTYAWMLRSSYSYFMVLRSIKQQ